MSVTFQQRILDNGLTIIAETDPEAHTSAAGFFVKTGARDESSDIMGVSHFLEHMMFKGTQRRTADDVNREFDEIGASYNAFTSSEMTCFHAHVLPEFLPAAIDILADILRPALRTEDFDTEKGVILEEIAMYKDNPFWTLYEEAINRHYRDHPLRHRVLGLEQTVQDLKRDQMLDYFEKRYSSDNTVVALAGRLDFEKSVEQINSMCGSWSASDADRDSSTPVVGAEPFTEHDEKVNRGYLLAITPAPASRDPRRYAAMMLIKALGDPGNSRLHWALIDPGLAEEAEAQFDPRDGVGDYYLYASCSPERIDEVWSVIEREVATFVETVTDVDLMRLRNKLATQITLSGERPSGRMQRLGSVWTYLAEHRPLEQELEAINAVTLDDIREVYEAFPFEPRTFGRLLPKS